MINVTSYIESIGICNQGWTSYGDSHCWLPVYDRMNWFAAYVHCKRLNGQLPTIENLSSIVSFQKDLFFWTDKRYRFKIEPRTNWTWSKSDLAFSDWWKWEIRIQTVGCYGCGFWNKGMIFLNADCEMKHTTICQFELLERELHFIATAQGQIECLQLLFQK